MNDHIRKEAAIRDALTDALAWADKHRWVADWQDKARAALAVQEPAVKAKQLVWTWTTQRRHYGAGDGVVYWINKHLCVCAKTLSEGNIWFPLKSGAGPRADLEAAKAAAQAHYEARILAVIEPVTDQPLDNPTQS